jgi:hypothetical protein
VEDVFWSGFRVGYTTSSSATIREMESLRAIVSGLDFGIDTTTGFCSRLIVIPSLMDYLFTQRMCIRTRSVIQALVGGEVATI